ncbi:MAG: GNAT family N-acetyltransferase [Clostridia bacterium]|nr:GNAT family N-acetyltransferase [Clostridia bacterium]
MIGLRRFCREDARAVQSVLYPNAALGEIEEMIADWNAGVWNGRRFELLAVTADGAIAGTVSLLEQSGIAASLGIEIVPAQRGRGIASEAMRLLLEMAAESGYRLIVDQVRADNAPSIRLHEKCGFTTDGRVYRNKRDRDVVYYVKLF